MGDRDFPDPGRPPYYSVELFSFIRTVHINTPLNIAVISVKEWCRLLLEHGITHLSDDYEAPPVLIPSKFEAANPTCDHLLSYRLARMFGLSPDQKSFLFKMLQDILPNKERLHRVGKVPSPNCTYCDEQVDNMEHLLTCQLSSLATTPLLQCLSSLSGNSTASDVVTLNMNVSEAMELPVVWLVSTCLSLVWEDRQAGRRTTLDSSK